MQIARILLVAEFLVAFTTRAAQVAWQAETPDGLLQVYDDDAYTLFAKNATGGVDAWLTSGPTAMHIGGQWYSTSVPGCSLGGCTTFADTDCRNVDLYYFNTTSPDACCTNCSVTPACGAWTFTGETVSDADVAADAPPAWANRCYVKAGCDYQSYGGHISGLPQSASPIPLIRTDAGPDGTGGYEIRYDAGTNVTVVTSFRVNATTNMFVFTQSFPLGATGVAIAVPVNVTSSGGRSEFASSTTPATQFPVFVPGNSSAEAALGFVSWRGRFFSAFGAGSGGAAAGLGAASGAEGGPIALFDGGGRQRVAILSVLRNFKSTMLGRPQNGRADAAAAGVSGYVTSLPENYIVETGVFIGSRGITDTVSPPAANTTVVASIACMHESCNLYRPCCILFHIDADARVGKYSHWRRVFRKD